MIQNRVAKRIKDILEDAVKDDEKCCKHKCVNKGNKTVTISEYNKTF